MEDFISFELAKLIKEKGFPQDKCDYGYITKDNLGWYNIGDRELILHIPDMKYIAAPTIAQVLKWLREEKRIEANGCYDNDEQGWIGYVCEMDAPDLYAFHALKEHHKFYEGAAVAAIEYVLNNNLI